MTTYVHPGGGERGSDHRRSVTATSIALCRVGAVVMQRGRWLIVPHRAQPLGAQCEVNSAVRARLEQSP